MTLGSTHVKKPLENIIPTWDYSRLRQVESGKWHFRDRQRCGPPPKKNEHAPGLLHEHACIGGMEIILERWDQSINWNLELRQVGYVEIGSLLKF